MGMPPGRNLSGLAAPGIPRILGVDLSTVFGIVWFRKDGKVSHESGCVPHGYPVSDRLFHVSAGKSDGDDFAGLSQGHQDSEGAKESRQRVDSRSRDCCRCGPGRSAGSGAGEDC